MRTKDIDFIFYKTKEENKKMNNRLIDDLNNKLISEVIDLISKNKDKVSFVKEWEEGESKKKLLVTNVPNVILTKAHLNVLIALAKLDVEGNSDERNVNIYFYYKDIVERMGINGKKISYAEIIDSISALSSARILYYYKDNNISYDFGTGIINHSSLSSVTEEEAFLVENDKEYINYVSINKKFFEYIKLNYQE